MSFDSHNKKSAVPWLPTIDTTELELNDNLKLAIHAIESKRRPKDRQLKYEIVRVNRVPSPFPDTPVSTSHQSTVIKGKFNPTPGLLHATYNRIKEHHERSSVCCDTSLDNYPTISINLPCMLIA
jgi:hypothetical protein